MVNKKLFALLLSCLFVLALFIFHGCSAARKPAPPDEPIPNQTKSDAMEIEKAQHIARETAKVDRVQKATVVVAGNKAYIGLDLEPGMDEKQVYEVENIVADRVKGTEDSIHTVYVSSDPNIVSRVKKISRGIARGDSVTQYARELTDIGDSIKPRTI